MIQKEKKWNRKRRKLTEPRVWSSMDSLETERSETERRTDGKKTKRDWRATVLKREVKMSKTNTIQGRLWLLIKGVKKSTSHVSACVGGGTHAFIKLLCLVTNCFDHHHQQHQNRNNSYDPPPQSLSLFPVWTSCIIQSDLSLFLLF